MHDDIQRYMTELSQVVQAMPFQLLGHAANMIMDCYRSDGTIFIMGNGGSAATASHFACDLAKGTRAEGLPPFRVLALTDNVPLITAWANDTSYGRIFAEQLATLARPRDLAVLISVSGTSPNVIAAAEAARGAGVRTIALTGDTGGALASLVDLPLFTPSTSMEQVEDAHMIVAHALCVALRARLRGEALVQAAGKTALESTLVEQVVADRAG